MIAEAIQEPIYYNRLYSHLRHEKYEETKEIIDDILRSEPKHNENVKNFVNGLRSKIYRTIMDEGICKIESISDFNPDNHDRIPFFRSDLILEYCVDIFQGKKPKLAVRRINSDIFDCYVDLPYTIELGKGYDHDMKCLLKKIGALETDVVKLLSSLEEEAKRINNLFNKNLKSKTMDLIVQIDDGKCHGECDFESS